MSTFKKPAAIAKGAKAVAEEPKDFLALGAASMIVKWAYKFFTRNKEESSLVDQLIEVCKPATAAQGERMNSLMDEYGIAMGAMISIEGPLGEAYNKIMMELSTVEVSSTKILTEDQLEAFLDGHKIQHQERKALESMLVK